MQLYPLHPESVFSCDFLFEVSHVGMKKPKMLKKKFKGNMENFHDKLHFALLDVQEEYFFVKCFVQFPNGDRNEVDVW